MEVQAVYKNARLSPQKTRLVADLIRGLPVGSAKQILQFSDKKAAVFVMKALDSAVANAENNGGADIDELKVKVIYVDEGPVMKRMRPRAKGRGAQILKRSSRILIKVSDE